ncbi:hypothetical protein Nepgr_022575 [Nepenthes gracilis]|uniref:Uncharacterized protein n=1 Tax=Nepenthes gracilis TaxID=150966 RepID=A0AAD3SZ41_NEPGR|nr:hypothetical protein Nepgr_022575 [Nepenthes gracilis]
MVGALLGSISLDRGRSTGATFSERSTAFRLTYRPKTFHGRSAATAGDLRSVGTPKIFCGRSTATVGDLPRPKGCYSRRSSVRLERRRASLPEELHRAPWKELQILFSGVI